MQVQSSPHNMGTKIVPTSWCERAALQGQYYVAQVCVDCLQEACKAIASLTRANQRGHAVYVVLAEGKSCSAVSPFCFAMLLLLGIWFAGSEEAVHVPAAHPTNLRQPSACTAGWLSGIVTGQTL